MFKDELRSLREANEMTQEELAKVLGLSKSAISMYENGNRRPDWKTAAAIADFFGVDIDMLLSREPLAQAAVRIPVLGTVTAGIPLEAVQDVLDYEEIPAQLAATGEFFALRVQGSSMEPKISDGDVVIVRRQPDIESGRIGIVMVNGEDATCKKIIKHDNGISLMPLNPTYQPYYYSNEEIESLPVTILGCVVELRAKL